MPDKKRPQSERLIYDPDSPETKREIARRIEAGEALGRTALAMEASEDGETVDLFAIEPTFEAAMAFHEPVTARDMKRAEDAGKRRQTNVENAKRSRKSRQHPQRDEALKLAIQMYEQRPELSHRRIGVLVASKMGDGAPVGDTITGWLRKEHKENK